MTATHATPSASGVRLIGASAGSGKTYRLTEEVTRAVLPSANDAIAVEGLVAVTYTNKAQAELETFQQGPRHELPAGQTLVSRFAQSVAEHQDRVAIEAADGSFTYGQLDARANRLAIAPWFDPLPL